VKHEYIAEVARRKSRVEKRLSRSSQRRRGDRMVGSGSRSFEVSKRCRATSHGGLGLVHEVTVATGLGPYTESDHVLNLAYSKRPARTRSPG
jgi:hypothetical protein